MFSNGIFLLPAYDSFVLSLQQRSLLFPFCFYATDINECSSPRACQLNQRCVNTVGSYTCLRLISCPQGYRVNNDICEGTSAPLSAAERWASGYGQCPRNPSRDCATACLQCEENTLFRRTITSLSRAAAVKKPAIMSFHT